MRRCRRSLSVLVIVTLLLGILQPAVSVQGAPDPVELLLAELSPLEKVGQLFLVSFPGLNAAQGSAVAELVQRYRIGGVYLSPANGNFSNDEPVVPQVQALSQALQALAYAPVPPAPTPTPSPTAAPTIAPPELPEKIHSIPLFIAVQQDGDGYPYTALRNGLTPLPSAMAIGATWRADLAEQVGALVGAQLACVGANMLLGPSLDVIQRTSTALPPEVGVRSFGGDPFWVGKLGAAYIAGVHQGSQRRVLTIAKHFPGLGSSDRRATEEVATIQKGLEELRRIELVPFFAVTAAKAPEPAAVTDGMMTSPFIRFRGLQGNIRQLTRPIGLDAEGMAALMREPELAAWRENGLLVSGPLGAHAVQRFYDPELQSFPHRSIALEAFMAGNDVLFLDAFSLAGDWQSHLNNVRDTIGFFVARYKEDAAFRARVDESVRRILRAKWRLYPGFELASVLDYPGPPDEQAATALVTAVAQSALTLLYPDPRELNERLPAPPGRDERILIITDSRSAVESPGGQASSYPLERALEDAILRLYGPVGSAQALGINVRSSSFAALKDLLEAEAAGKYLNAMQRMLRSRLQQANWLVFLMQDVDPVSAPASDALKLLLKQRPELIRGKHIVVFALHAPCFLDATEVSKLTAYYALYSKTKPFIEAAARALYRELTPSGKPPVDVAAINYELIAMLEPDPSQVIGLAIQTPQGSEEGPIVRAGSSITVRTSAIKDRNGNLVPDGTPVSFRLYYPAESLELPRQTVTTVNGIAETTIVLERTGRLEITASTPSGASSTTLVITIRGDEPALIATILPPTATPRPTRTPTATAEPGQPAVPPQSGQQPSAVSSRALLRLGSLQERFYWGLGGIAIAEALAAPAWWRRPLPRAKRLRICLLGAASGLAAYCLLAFLRAAEPAPPQWATVVTASATALAAAMSSRQGLHPAP